MKIKSKRILALTCLVLALIGTTAFATTRYFSYTFTNTTYTADDNYATYAYKNDSDQKWYITLLSGDASSTNILGVRMHSADRPTTVVSSYFTHTANISYNHVYRKTVSQYENMYIGYKKDSDSSSSNDLYVYGRYTP